MKRNIIILFLSLFIAVLDGIFVYINHQYSQETFKANIAADAHRSHLTFEVALNQMYTDLLMVASLYAESPEIQQLFYSGMKAVHREGGGAGGEMAAYWRTKLFDEIGHGWLAASQQFHIRQLHFHLGPGSTSFLRVHSADKFGDNMDDVRFIIVEANKTLQQQTGFETGRVYSGLRGVVPMFATDGITGQKVHVGALEAGTSFSKIIEILDDGLGTAFSVLLTEEHVSQTMWSSTREKLFGKTKENDCRCLVEASSRPGVEKLLDELPFTDGFPKLETPYFVDIGQTTYAATFYPLRDFLGHKDPARENTGAILVWQDVTAALNDLEHQQWINIFYAVFAFILFELLLIGALNAVTRGLENAVTQRTLELNDVNRALEREIVMKNRFFSIIAHDLRSPFTALLGMTQMMESQVDLKDPAKVRDYARLVRKAGEQFYQLLHGLLEWTAHQMEHGAIEPYALALSGCVEDVVSVLAPIAAEKKVTIVNTAGAFNILADHGTFSTVLRNLISNAVKFVEPGGRVEVSARDDGESIAIMVTDNGVGLGDLDPEELFSIDQKTSTTGTNGEVGTGLGLPLCKELVEDMGGTIRAENLLDGQGARFTFTLPKPPTA